MSRGADMEVRKHSGGDRKHSGGDRTTAEQKHKSRKLKLVSGNCEQFNLMGAKGT